MNEKVDHWERHEAAANERAMEALTGATTADDLVAVVKRLAEDYREIPARMRATEMAATIAAELVEVLTAGGMVFANPEMAPTQIAGSILAAWMRADAGVFDSVDWLAVAGCLPDAVAWAMDNGDTAEPGARQEIERLLEGRA